MKIEISENAQSLLAKKGGIMAIDFIKPVG